MKNKKKNTDLSKIGLLILNILLLSVFFTLSVAAEDGQATFSNTVKEFWQTYSGEILCALAFVGSILTGILYKTGLLPLVKAALGAIGEKVCQTSDATQSFGKTAQEALTNMGQNVEKATLCAASSAESVTALQEKLLAMEEVLQKMLQAHEKTTAVLRTETELLYRMLQNVNLPQVQKDSMTESYLILKSSLEGSACDG